MQLNELNKEKLSSLVEMIRLTKPEELTCDDLIDHVAGYADACARDLPAPAGSEAVQQHLLLCCECMEEFQALVDVLRSK
jgi:hypothetical protein